MTVKIRLTVRLAVQRVPTPESKRRPLLSWCNERTGLATMLMLVATILILGLMVWQQFTGPPPWLACPPATRVCVVNTITNNFYGPVQVRVGPRGAADARSSSRYDGANKRPGGDEVRARPRRCEDQRWPRERSRRSEGGRMPSKSSVGRGEASCSTSQS